MNYQAELAALAAMSNKYGSNPAYVLAGGGNTSCKDEKYLYVKPSGVSLAKITEQDFVKMDRSIIRECFCVEQVCRCFRTRSPGQKPDGLRCCARQLRTAFGGSTFARIDGFQVCGASASGHGQWYDLRQKRCCQVC